MMGDQAEWIAELVCGDLAPPDEATMRRGMEEEQAYLRRHFPGSPRYALELDPTFYRQPAGARAPARPRRGAESTGRRSRPAPPRQADHDATQGGRRVAA